jgi:hypothetical protein
MRERQNTELRIAMFEHLLSQDQVPPGEQKTTGVIWSVPKQRVSWITDGLMMFNGITLTM